MSITTILQPRGRFNICNDWSKKNKARYNYQKNIKLWNWCQPIYTISLLVYILKNKYHKYVNYIKSSKAYEPITFKNCVTKKLEVNNEYVNNIWSYDDFLKHDIQITKSTTGTGKTTATSQHRDKNIGNSATYQFSYINNTDDPKQSTQSHI